MDEERRNALIVGGIALVAGGGLLLLTQKKPPAAPAPAPRPTLPASPPPSGASCSSMLTVGNWPNWDGSLWGIATRMYGNGALYPRLYAANAGVIEQAAQAHGFAGSDAGHWIFPGTQLCIP